MTKAVIILSGGMDSATLLYDMEAKGLEIIAVSFDYGQRHSKELECAAALCEKLNVEHKIIDLSVLHEIAPSVLTKNELPIPDGEYNEDDIKLMAVPNRNMVMIALATSYAISIGAHYIAYGAHAGDHALYADCTPKFVRAMEKAVEACDYAGIKLLVPYLYMTKGEIAKVGLSLGVDYSLTWSCYKGGDLACGKCATCIERLEAFTFAGSKDPIEYEEDVEESLEDFEPSRRGELE